MEQSDGRTVVWRPQTFPPHWVGTTIRCQIMTKLEQYAETGEPDPVFT